MRQKARIDGNQPSLVKQLRALGCSVQSLGQVGEGCPDLLVGLSGRNYLFEVKDPSKVPSKRVLTPDQVRFHQSWSGQVAVVETLDDCLAVLGQ